jgi:CubicO group peptidase (beta-lactamase class C family)
MRTAWLFLAMALVLEITASPAAEMAFPGAAWEEKEPGSQGILAEKLRRAVEFLEKHTGSDGVRELVIVRSGCLVWKGDQVEKVHGIWSATKSFTSTCLGLLVADGKCTLETKAAEIVPELAAHYPEITLRHLATMTSGYRAEGDEPRGSYLHGPSPTPFVPWPEPLFTPPGSRYAYWDSAMNLLGLVLTRIAGEPLEKLFERRVAGPIGMSPKKWDWGDSASDRGIVVNGGSGNGDRHIFISALELARLGHLFLNRGRWKGEQIIPESWVREATSVQVKASTPLGHPESGIDGRGVYGLNWWVNGIRPDGSRKWPGAPAGTFSASGYNNNDLFIISEWSMVIVRLGLDQRDRKISDAEYGEFLRLVGESLTAD